MEGKMPPKRKVAPKRQAAKKPVVQAKKKPVVAAKKKPAVVSAIPK